MATAKVERNIDAGVFLATGVISAFLSLAMADQAFFDGAILNSPTIDGWFENNTEFMFLVPGTFAAIMAWIAGSSYEGMRYWQSRIED